MASLIAAPHSRQVKELDDHQWRGLIQLERASFECGWRISDEPLCAVPRKHWGERKARFPNLTEAWVAFSGHENPVVQKDAWTDGG